MYSTSIAFFHTRMTLYLLTASFSYYSRLLFYRENALNDNIALNLAEMASVD